MEGDLRSYDGGGGEAKVGGMWDGRGLDEPQVSERRHPVAGCPASGWPRAGAGLLLIALGTLRALVLRARGGMLHLGAAKGALLPRGSSKAFSGGLGRRGSSRKEAAKGARGRVAGAAACGVLVLALALPWRVAGQSVTAVSPVNAPAAGATNVTVIGTSFGTSDTCQRARIGGTAAEASVWVSDGSLTCKLASGIGATKEAVLTVSAAAATLAEALTYDVPSILGNPTNGPTFHQVFLATVSLSGAEFGTASSTPQARVGGSACEASSWVSDSSLSCRVPVGIGRTHGVGLTAGLQLGTLTEVFSFDIPTAKTVPTGSNNPYNGNAPMTISGNDFSASSLSLAARLGHSASEESVWISDTSMRCKHVVFGGLDRFKNPLTVTVGVQAGASLTGAWSYDASQLAGVAPVNCAVTGKCLVTISGAGLGVQDSSVAARLGGTSCQTTPWVSETSLVCQMPGGRSPGRGASGIVATVSQRVYTLAATFTYDATTITGGTLGAWDGSSLAPQGTSLVMSSSEGGKVGFEGTNLISGNAANVTAVTFGVWPTFDSYACDIDHSAKLDTRLVCTVPPGAGTNMKFKVVVDGRLFVGTDALSYPPPALSAGTISLAETGLPGGVSVTGTTTVGGVDLVQMRGRNFGGVASQISVAYGPGGAATYPCNVSFVNHSLLRCYTASGSGTGHTFNVTVGRQSAVGTDTFSYPAPTLTGGQATVTRPGGSVVTSGVGSTTLGGIDVLTLVGANFGPSPSDVQVWLQASSSAAGRQLRCAVVRDDAASEAAAHTLVRCLPPSGSGTGFAVNLSVGGQAASLSSVFHYPPPTITDGSLRIVGVSCVGPTRCYSQRNVNGRNRAVGRTTHSGVDVLEMSGLNFGPNSSAVSVTIGKKVSGVYTPSGDCVVLPRAGMVSNHTRLLCYAPQGVGLAYTFQVTADGQASPAGSDLFSYPDPQIFSGTLRLTTEGAVPSSPAYRVAAAGSVSVAGTRTTAGDVVEFNGQNFGPLLGDITIVYGPDSDPSKYSCPRLAVSGGWSHTTARCAVAAGSGKGLRFMVKMASGQQSLRSGDALAYPAPAVSAGSLRYNCSASAANVLLVEHQQATPGATTTVVTSQGGVGVCMGGSSAVNATGTLGGDLLRIDGAHFGPDPADVVVTYTRPLFPFTYQAQVLSEAFTDTSLSVLTAEGTGRDHVFTVNVSGQAAVGADVYSYPINNSLSAGEPSTAASYLVSDALLAAVAGAPQRVVLHARNAMGAPLLSGGAGVLVQANGLETSFAANATDNNDGTYAVTTTYTRSGSYTISVLLRPSLAHVQGSPFDVTVTAEPVVDVTLSSVNMPNTVQTAGASFAYVLLSRDRYDNEITGLQDLFYADAGALGFSLSKNETAVIVPSPGDRLSVQFTLTVSGSYALRVFYNGSLFQIASNNVGVVPNVDFPSSGQLTSARSFDTDTDSTVQFTMKMADEYNNAITKGGARIITSVVEPVPLDFDSLSVVDGGDGTYTLVARLTISGSYSITVGLGDIGRTFPFSPLYLTVAPGAPTASVSSLGSGATIATAGVLKAIVIFLTDAYGNQVPKQATSPLVELYSQSGGILTQTNSTFSTFANVSSSNFYSGSFYREKAGMHILIVTFKGVNMLGSPYSVQVVPAAIEGSKCTAQQTVLSGAELTSAIADGLFGQSDGVVLGGLTGAELVLVISAKDAFGNLAINTQTSLFTISTAPSVSSSGPTYTGGFSTYTASLFPTNTGLLAISVRYNNQLIGAGAAYQASIFSGRNIIDATRSYAFGFPTSIAGGSSHFYIQAVDNQNIPLVTGGSTFAIALLSSQNISSIGALLSTTDSGAGWYKVSFTPTISGTYSVSLSLSGGSAISNSPVTLEVNPGPINALATTLSGNGLTIATSEALASFVIQARDPFGNLRPYDPSVGASFSASIVGRSPVRTSLTDYKNGTYTVSYNITISGAYTLEVRTVGGDLAGASPFALSVQALGVDPGQSLAYASDVGIASTAGGNAEVVLSLRDKYSNPTPNASEPEGVNVFADGAEIVSGAVSKRVNADDTLSVLFILTRSGTYTVQVQLATKVFTSENVSLTVQPSVPFVNSTIVSLAQPSPFRVDESVSVSLFAADVYGNNITVGGASFTVRMSGTTNGLVIAPDVTDNGDGSYGATFATLQLGNFSLDVILLDASTGAQRFVSQTPVEVIIGFMSRVTSVPVSLDSLLATAGTAAQVVIAPKDGRFNPTDFRTEAVTATATPSIGQAFLNVSDEGSLITVTLNTTRAGNYTIAVSIGASLQLTSSPFLFQISPAAVKPALSSFTGDGLTAAVAGVKSSFSIQVTDEYGNVASNDPFQPAPSFVMTLTSFSNGATKAAIISSSVGSTFVASYLITASGIYQLSVTFGTTNTAVAGFPVNCTVSPTAVSAATTAVTEILPSPVNAGDTISVKLESRDFYGNKLLGGGNNFTTELFQVLNLALNQQGVVMTDAGDGTYSFQQQATRSGVYFLGVFLGDEHVAGSPASITVQVGAASSGASTGEGTGLVSGLINVRLPFRVLVRDVYGNQLLSGYTGAVQTTITYVNNDVVTETLSQDSSFSTAVYSSNVLDTQEGTVTLSVTVAGGSIAGSPFSVSLLPATNVGSPSASKSFAEGIGISSATAGVASSFVIQAADSNGNFLTQGGALFINELTLGTFYQVVPTADNGDGTYGVSVEVTASGTYQLSVNYLGAAISGSPFSVDVFPAATNAQSSSLSGGGLTAGTAGVPGTFTIQARDQFSNVQRYFFGDGASIFTISVKGPVTQTATLRRIRDSAFIVTYSVTVAGSYQVYISVSGTPSLGPIALTVYPWLPSSQNSMVAGLGASLAVAGESAQFRWRPRDQFGNLILKATSPVLPQFSFSPAGKIAAPTVASDGEGTVIATYLATVGGDYFLSVLLPGTSVQGTGWNVTVSATVFSAAASSAEGAGVLLNTAGADATFSVVARDAYSNRITQGFTFTTLVSQSGAKDFRANCSDATYRCSYLVTRSGTLSVAVLKGAFHLSGSPYSVGVLPNVVQLDASSTANTNLATAGKTNTFFIILRDTFGNQLTEGGNLFSVKLTGRDIIVVPQSGIADSNSGGYSVSYFASVSGDYTLSILSQSLPVAGSPLNMTISPGFPSVSRSSFLFQQLFSCGSVLCGTVDNKQDVVLTLRDVYSNLVNVDVFTLLLSTVNDGFIRYGLITKGPLDGEYFGSFSATASGTYTISITASAQNIGASPLTAIISPNLLINSGSIELSGSSLTIATAGNYVPFQMQARDVFGNPVMEPAFEQTLIQTLGPDGDVVTLDTNLTKGSGLTVDIALKITRSGGYRVFVSLLGIDASGAPFSLIVRPAAISAAASTPGGSGAVGGAVNVAANLVLSPRDQYGNLAAFVGSLFQGIKGKLLYPNGNEIDMQVFLFSTVEFDYEPAGSAVRHSKFVLIYLSSSATSGVFAEVTIFGTPIASSPLPITFTFSVGSASTQSFATVDSATAGVTSSFVIQAADSNGLWLTTGGATFTASLSFVNDYQLLTPTDNGDGTYTVSLQVTVSGTYTLSIDYGAASIVNSPFSLTVFPGATSAQATVLSGLGLTEATAGTLGQFLIQARDQFSNVQRYFFGDGSAIFSVSIAGPSSRTATLSAVRDSQYVASYTVTTAGSYTVSLSVAGDTTTRSWAFTVFPSTLSLASSSVDQAALSVLHPANAEILIPINARDAIGNIFPPPQVSGDLSEFRAEVLPGGKATVVRNVAGKYTALFNVTLSGSYSLAVYIGESAFPTSPYAFTVGPGPLSAEATTASGSALGGGLAGMFVQALVFPRDAYGNPIMLGSDSDLSMSISGGADGAELTLGSVSRAASRAVANFSVSRACSACSLSLSVLGLHVVGSPFTATFLPADAPRVLSAYFTPLLTGADVTFDVPTDRHGQLGGVFDCLLAFDEATVAGAGPGSSCTWRSGTLLSLIFGSSAALMPGSSVVLREMALKNAVGNSYNASGSAVLLLPASIEGPHPFIVGPRAVGSCESLTLDGTQSSGGGGRPLSFQWGVQLGPSNRDTLAAALAALPATQDKPTLAPGSLLAGESYTFSLLLRDTFGQEGIAAHPVTADPAALPTVSIVGVATGEVPRSRALTLNGEVSLSSCGSSSTAAFFWESVGGPLLPISAKTVASSTINIPANTLVSGNTYTVRLTATAGGAASYADLTLRARSSELVASIQGGDRTVTASRDLVLDASDSVDPDGEPGSPSFTWSCLPSPCFPLANDILLESGPVLTVPASQLSAGATLSFTVSVAKDPGPRRATTTARITLTSEALADVRLTVQGGARARYNSGARLVLSGAVSNPAGTCEPTFRWSAVGDVLPLPDPATRTTPLDATNLVVNPGVQVPGATYVVELRGGCAGALSEGLATLTVAVNSPPRGGFFAASPLAGAAAQTPFALSCAGWVDDAADLPLSYLFQSLRVLSPPSGDPPDPLGPLVRTNAVTALLPGPPPGAAAAHTVRVSALVCDALSECASPAGVDVAVSGPPAGTTAASLLDAALAAAQGVGRLGTVVQVARAVATVMNEEEAAGGGDGAGGAAERGRVVDALLSTSRQSDLTREMVGFLAAAASPALASPSLPLAPLHDTALELLRGLSSESLAQGIEGPAAASVAAALSGMAQSADLLAANATSGAAAATANARRATVAGAYDGISQVMRELGMALLVGRVAYEERQTTVGGTLRQTVWRLDGADASGAKRVSETCPAGMACPGVRLPVSWEWTPPFLDTQVLVWGPRARHAEAGAYRSSPITSVLAMSGSSVVEGRTGVHPVIVDLQVTPAPAGGGGGDGGAASGRAVDDIIADCEYWDAPRGAWSRRGCISLLSNSSAVSCACYHLTDFASVMRATGVGLKDLSLALQTGGAATQPPQQDGYGFAVVGISAVGTLLLAVAAHLWDRFQRHRFQPDLSPELLARGYVRAVGQHRSERYRLGLFIGMFGKLLWQHMVLHHGVASILLWTPRDRFTRAPRVVALLLYLGSTMVVSILMMAYAGFTDVQAVDCGIVTSLILLPLHPLLTATLRSIAPRDRKSSYQRDRPFSAEHVGLEQPRVQGVVFEQEWGGEGEGEVPPEGMGVREEPILQDIDDEEGWQGSEGEEGDEEEEEEEEAAAAGFRDLSHNLRAEEEEVEGGGGKGTRGPGRPGPAASVAGSAGGGSSRADGRKGGEGSGAFWSVGEAFGSRAGGLGGGGGLRRECWAAGGAFGARRFSQHSVHRRSSGGGSDLGNVGDMPGGIPVYGDGGGYAQPAYEGYDGGGYDHLDSIGAGGDAQGGGGPDPRRPHSGSLGSRERPASLPPLKRGGFDVPKSPAEKLGLSTTGGGAGAAGHLPRPLLFLIYLCAALYYCLCAVIVFLHSYDMGESTRGAWTVSYAVSVAMHFLVYELSFFICSSFYRVRTALIRASYE